MKVAIIGAGNVGKAVVPSLFRAGHEVVLSARSLNISTNIQNGWGWTSAWKLER